MKQPRGHKKSRRGQVALEYLLTTLTMALVASLLYVFYQPIVSGVFTPLDLPNKQTGLKIKDRGLGLKDVTYLPVP